jgi:hypothetical protein
MSGVTCGYCGRTFAEDQGQPACASCPLKGGCRFLRCPHCGYENPCPPHWVERLRGWLGSESGRPNERDEASLNTDAREAHKGR